MVTVRNIVVDAFKMIGEINDASDLDGTQSVVGLQLLNDVISALNLDNYFAFTNMVAEHTVVTPASVFGISTVPGSTILSERPAAVKRLYFRDSSLSNPSEVTQVAPQDIIRFQRANSIGAPNYFAYVSNYPTGELVFDVAVQSQGVLSVVYNRPIPASNAFNDTLAIPPEYQGAIKYHLALTLARRYGKPVEVVGQMQALVRETDTMIKRNTATKTPLIHMLDDGNRCSATIYSGGDW